MDLKILALLAVTGCGGATFSMETVPAGDGGGDAVVKMDENDARTVAVTDAGTEAAPVDVDAAPETGLPSEAGVDAAPEAAPPVCLSTLNDVGTGDFRISFTVTSTGAQTIVPLANQRAGCNQTSVLWQALIDGRNWGGKVVFDMCDVTGQGSCPTGPTVYTASPVDDGQPHRIVIERVSGVISISSDGVPGTTSPDTALGVALAGEGADASFETFGAPLAIGTDDCGDPPLAAYGTLTDMCVTRP